MVRGGTVRAWVVAPPFAAPRRQGPRAPSLGCPPVGGAVRSVRAVVTREPTVRGNALKQFAQSRAAIEGCNPRCVQAATRSLQITRRHG
mgnify:CR=1 FL=1